MSDLFRVIFSMSLSGSVLILLILLIRPLMKERFSKFWQYYVWMIVLIRLLVPYAPEHSLVNDLFHTNVIHSLTTELQNANAFLYDAPGGKNVSATQQTLDQQDNATQNNGALNSAELSHPSGNPEHIDYSKQVWSIAGILWLSGFILLLIWKVYHYILFTREITSDGEPVADYEIIKIYHRISVELGIRRIPQLRYSFQASSPMLVGLFKPVIYLTDTTLQLGEESLSYVLRHELIHHKRHDIWYKWFCELALSIHWFNPFLYLMSRQMNTQCEISCDEAIARDLSMQDRRIYGNILLNTASENINRNKHILSTTLYEDKEILKERILSIMNAKRKTRKAIMLSLSIALLISTAALMLGACSLKKDIPNVSAEVNSELETDTTDQATPTPGAQVAVTDTPTASNEVINENTSQNNEAQDVTDASQTVTDPQNNEDDNNGTAIYSNTEYGFDFTLPISWEGYTIQSEDWQGTALEGDQQGTVVEKGTKLMIRHPKWTTDDPRQDIPIMVFTLDQWDQVINEKIAVSAAPLPPSELGRNSSYVFALPARYNFAFPTGYEEVDQIIQSGALVGNENMK